MKNNITANIEDVEKSFIIVNTINFLRKGDSNSSLEDVGYIFITATKSLLKLASNEEICKKNDVPFATSIDFMINRFWFKYQMRINKNDIPISFSIALQAKLISKSLFSDKLKEEYDKLEEYIRRNTLSQEELMDRISEFRKQMTKLGSANDFDYIAGLFDEEVLAKRGTYVKTLEAKQQEHENEVASLESIVKAKDDTIANLKIEDRNKNSKIEMLNSKINDSFIIKKDIVKRFLFAMIKYPLFFYLLYILYDNWESIERCFNDNITAFSIFGIFITVFGIFNENNRRKILGFIKRIIIF